MMPVRRPDLTAEEFEARRQESLRQLQHLEADELVEAERRAAPEDPHANRAPAPASDRCGKCAARRRYSEREPLCWPCMEERDRPKNERARAEREALAAEERARAAIAAARKVELQAAKERAIEASPHRCGCGARVLAQEETCLPCFNREREAYWAERRLDTALDTVPERLKWARLGAPELGQRVKDPRAVMKLRTTLATNDVDRFLLIGAAGVGKSTLAVCAMLDFVRRRDVHGVFLDSFELAVARQNHALGSEAPEVRRALNAGVVVVDDLAAERAIPSSPIGEILHKRHAAALVTIVTSGFTLEQLEQRYGSGVFRRLTEDAEVIEFRARKGGA
jgi:DNA replication protein DnaC